MQKSSDTGGAKPIAITGRLAREKERVLGMTEEEREWRKLWMKDQVLSHNEPRVVPEIYKELRNPIRRMYQAPLNILANKLEPVVGKNVHRIRYVVGKILMAYVGITAAIYYFKYNTNDWKRLGGIRVFRTKQSVLPGDPEYPKVVEKEYHEYAARGFDKVTLKL